MKQSLDPDLLFTRHPDPIWVFDLESLRILRVNDAAIAHYGYSEAEFLAMGIGDLHAAEDVPPLIHRIERLEHTGNRLGVWRQRRKNGDTILSDITVRPIEHDGARVGLASMREVTDANGIPQAPAPRNGEPNTQAPNPQRAGALQTTGSRLKEQEATLRTAQRLLRLGIWKLNLDTGTLTWSDNVHEIYGVDRDHIVDNLEAYRALVHPDDLASMSQTLQDYLANPSTDFAFEHRILGSDGRNIHIRGTGELTETEEGRLLTGVVQDITDEVESTQRLSRASLLQRIAGHAAHLGGWRVNLQEGLVEWSEETAAIHEVSGAQVFNVDEAIEFYAPEYRERIKQLFSACAERGIAYDETLQLITARGNRRWVRSIAEPEYGEDGGIIAVSGAFQDVTDQVQMREQSEMLARRLYQTLDSMSDGFFLIDENFRFAYLNPKALSLLNRETGELIGSVVWDAFPQPHVGPFKKQYEFAMHHRKSVHFTRYFEPLSMWFSVDAYPVPEGLAIYFRDVSQERKREAQLRLLEAAVSRQNDILLITEAEPVAAPDGPKIVYVNDAFVRKTGFSREQAIGRTPRILQGPKTQRTELNRIRRALESWQSVRAELINYTKSGEEFWLELDIIPLTDENGWNTHWVSVERDITKRKRAEETVRISEERFHLVARATNDVVWDWDLNSNTLWWNEALKSLFGYDRDRLEPGPESWSNRIHPDDRDAVVAGIEAVIASDQTHWQDEYRFLHANGKPHTVIDRGFVIRDHTGTAVRMVGSLVDVTERRDMAERLRQAQKLEAVGQLTGGVAHDFNNLLTVILGNSELLKEELGDQQQLRLLAEMTATAAERGAELTNRLLAFARRQPLDPKIVDINRLVAGMENLLRRTLNENIEIELVRAGGLWSVEVDPGQLESALLNLALNARDAMPEGGRLTIETANARLDDTYADEHYQVVAGQYVLISVSDTGTGMAPEIVGQAFEPFFTTKQMGKGSGLGLSMVYGFVRQSDGHIKIYSEPGEGTTVKLYFPRAQAHADTPLQRAGETSPAGQGEHILLVEDDPLVCDHVKSLLVSLGYRVSSANSGPEAVDIIKHTADIDLLFTDVIMPGGMNGRELAEAAKRLRPELKILFTSGYTENAIVHHGRLDRGVHLLSKPYRRQELAAKVRKVLEEKNGSN